MRKERVGFIGAGQMAESIARGIVDAKLLKAGSLMASDPTEARRDVFEDMGALVTADNLALVARCGVLIVAVKPQSVPDLLAQIGPKLRKDQTLITICAGVSTSVFEAAAAVPLRVVRAMPNLPMRVRLGATALCHGRHATEEDMKVAGEIFSAAGRAVQVEEGMMDAVTAISGSGPAYFCFLVEVMIEAGILEGLDPRVARTLAIQTARGAAAWMDSEDTAPEDLRKRVTSKGGTTEAAFRTMDELKVRHGLLAGILAAAERSRELGK